jgi:hypothetical protein
VTRPRKPKKPRRGRPPLPAGEARASLLPSVRVSAEDRAAAEREAAAHGVALSEWLRRRAVHAGAEPAA